MIVSVGVDAVAIARVQRRLEEDGGFCAAFLAPWEAPAVVASSSAAEAAARWFAAKEAIVKVLGVDGSDGVLFKDIELDGPAARPSARLAKRAEAAASRLGVARLHVATCAAAGRVVAVAVAERGAPEKEMA